MEFKYDEYWDKMQPKSQQSKSLLSKFSEGFWDRAISQLNRHRSKQEIRMKLRICY